MKYRILIIIIVILSLLTFCSCIEYTYHYHGYQTDKVFVTDDNIYIMSCSENFYWKDGEKVYVNHNIHTIYPYNDTVYILTRNDEGYINYYINDDKYETGIIGKTISIFVYDDEVYIAGTISEKIDNNYKTRAFYWSETEGQVLLTDPYDDGSADYDYEVTSMFIENNNVYVTGYSGLSPCYWVNEDYFILEGRWANSIFVENGDIYIAGETYDEYGDLYACYWKNNERFNLDKGWGNYICVENGNVYVSGVFIKELDLKIGCYWKNEKRIDFSSVPKLTGIAVKNSSVVTAGYVSNSYERFLSFDIDVYRYPYCWVDSFKTSLSN